MRRTVLVSSLAILTTLSPMLASAEDFQAIYERVGKQRHLAMIEKGISTNNARTIAMLAYMTYAQRACGDATVTAEDIDKIWAVLKSGTDVDDGTRESETGTYADELEKAVTGLASFDKAKFCDETTKSVVAMKADWGIN